MAEDLGWSTGKVAMADKVWSKADDEIKLRAERRMGEMLKEIELNKGAITPGTNRGTTQLHDVTSSPKLSDIGIEKHESSRWQKIKTCRSRRLK
jgi:hypothetical protein